jgi:ribose 5-phosphate isomerase RpiB
MVAAIDAKRGVNVNNHGNGIAIKGTGSGPSIVLASNFAPGTSAADIQSALEAFAGEIVSCQVTSHHPVVTAEIACAERWGAENVVANFNNQKVRIERYPPYTSD